MILSARSIYYNDVTGGMINSLITQQHDTQRILEQHGFELLWSTCTFFFLYIYKYRTVLSRPYPLHLSFPHPLKKKYSTWLVRYFGTCKEHLIFFKNSFTKI